MTPRHTDGTLASAPAIVGGSHATAEILLQAQRAAATDATVLVTGESGSGKRLVARFIQARSARATRPFTSLSCAAARDLQLESECFGHVKGSFGGAQRDAVGQLELADSGTILLDEISCASMPMQVKLLRFLETGKVQPLGAGGPGRRLDVRVIATTSANLTHLAHSGAFREDLLYRLCVAQIHLPPLRERPEDIAPLVEHTIAKTGRAVPPAGRRSLRRTRVADHLVLGRTVPAVPGARRDPPRPARTAAARFDGDGRQLPRADWAVRNGADRLQTAPQFSRRARLQRRPAAIPQASGRSARLRTGRDSPGAGSRSSREPD